MASASDDAGAGVGDDGAGVVILFVAAICHAGIAARPSGRPELKGLALRLWNEGVGSMMLIAPLVFPLLAFVDAGLGVEALSVDGTPLLLAVGAWVMPGM